MASRLEVFRNPEEERGEQVGVVLKGENGQPYTAIQATIIRKDLVDIGVHRATREGRTCNLLGGQRCQFEAHTSGDFPTERKEQVRALIGKLKKLHPSMVPIGRKGW